MALTPEEQMQQFNDKSKSQVQQYNEQQQTMQMGTGNPQSATYQASLGPAATNQQPTQFATQITPEQMAAQQQANAAQNSYTPTQQPAAVIRAGQPSAQQNVAQQPAADAIQAQMQQQQKQQQISNAMQERFGERGKPDNFIPEFESKMKALQDNMKATNSAFFTSKGIAEGDYPAMRKYMRDNPNAEQELDAALQTDQQQVDSLTQQLESNPAFQAFQTEAREYQQQLESDGIKGSVDDFIGGPALPPDSISTEDQDLRDILQTDPVLEQPPTTDSPKAFSPQQDKLDVVNQELADLYANKDTDVPGPELKGEARTKALDEFSQTIYKAVADDTYDEKYDLVAPFGEITTEDGIAAQRFQTNQPVDQAVTDKMNALLESARGTVKLGAPRDYIPIDSSELPEGFTVPAEGVPTEETVEVFHNPITGETFTATTTGFGVPANSDWVRGAPPEGQWDAISAKTKEQQNASLAAMGEGQQRLVSTAIKNPENLARKAAVATIDPDAAGTMIAAGTGDAGATTDITAKTITDGESADTPEDITAATYDAAQSTDKVKQALEGGVDFQTMIDNINVATRGGEPLEQFTGEISWDATAGKFKTAGTEGGYDQTGMPIVGMPPREYTPEEFSEEFDTPLVTTGGVKAAQDGDVTKSVTGAVGTLSEGAQPVGATMDPDFDADIAAGKRVVGDKELVKAQGQDAEAIKTAIAQGEAAAPIEAAQTTVGTKEIAKAAQIAEKDMATAEAMTMDGLADDAVAVAKKMEAFTIDDGTLAEFKEGKIEAQDTVQGQLTSLMASFDDGTPAWAAGAMRAANEAMATRGLSGSSMAAASIVQAAMESALPIAMQDADTFRSMKLDNLGRQQQIALTNAAAQQGVKLQNFTAEQTAMLQNSQNAFSLQTQNLSNMQAAVIATAQIKASLQGKNLDNQQQANLAEAARYAEVNNLNLNNRQQALLQDSLNNTQVSLANLSNRQKAYTTDANLAAALQGQQIDNKQQTAVLNSARYTEANNLSFSSEERAVLHNSELMTSIGLAELSNKQSATLQKAAAFASMDMANLSNQQQAQVENARNFLQMDLANLSNEQQVEIFKAQSIQQSILSDTAASNAAKQFNASSENQTNQFMADLKSTTDRFNVTQANAIKQFNVSEENAIATFNKEQADARDEFNTKNALVVAQSNALWRQSVATANTAAQNEANMQLAKTENAFTASTLDQVWQRERDLLSYAWQADNNALDRINNVIIQDMISNTATSNAAAAAAATERASRANMWGQIGAAAVKGADIFNLG
tara:strand:- start:21 stop:3863 length:3843 start_codon:yes stop_codon:yes gene_type:complete